MKRYRHSPKRMPGSIAWLVAVLLSLGLVPAVFLHGNEEQLPYYTPEAFDTCPLIQAMIRLDNDLLAERIASGGPALLGQICMSGETPLTYAIADEQPEAVRLLIKAGVDVNQPDGNGILPIFSAAMRGTHMLRLLVAAGAEVDRRNQNGETPLHAFVSGNAPSADGVRALLAAGILPSASDGKGRTPLHVLARTGQNTETAAALIAAGADLNARDARGETPLHRACRVENTTFVRFLCAAGANPAARNRKGQTPQDVWGAWQPYFMETEIFK